MKPTIYFFVSKILKSQRSDTRCAQHKGLAQPKGGSSFVDVYRPETLPPDYQPICAKLTKISWAMPRLRLGGQTR